MAVGNVRMYAFKVLSCMNNHKTAGQGIVPYLNPFFFLPTWEEVVPDSTDVMRAAPTGVCTGYDETKIAGVMRTSTRI